MKIPVKFTEETFPVKFDSGESFNAKFGEVYENGYSQAEVDAAVARGVEQGVESGKEAERAAFWGVFQANGARTNYDSAFFDTNWNAVNFRPVYDMKPKSAENMFRGWNTRTARSFDLVAVLESCGVSLDLSNCTNITRIFNSSTDIGHIGVMDVRKITSYTVPFAYSHIRTIDKMIVDENTPLSSIFTSYSSLRNITFEGVIGTTANFQWCTSLTVASMKNIISCLKDYSGTDNAEKCTLYFTDDCWAALEADSTAPNGDTWKNYVNQLGWLT